jgi:serine/threonine-protein kinase HipA
LEGSVQNEALCMVLAKRIGLNTANVTTGRAGKRTYLLVERYDRRAGASGPARLHQEDFCQALGKPPAAKYQHNQVGIRGPSLGDMFGVVRQHMPATDLLALLDAVILNVLMTNVDSHAKNYSIMLSGNGVRLAPLYDLMAGDAWPDITLNMAQDIGGQRRGKHVEPKNWRRFAEECQFNPAQVLRRVQSVSKRVTGALDVAAEEVRVMPAGDHFMLNVFVETIEARVKTVNVNLAENTTAE